MTAATDDAATRRDALRRLRSSLAVLAMVAAGKPDEVLDRLPLLLKVCQCCYVSAVYAAVLCRRDFTRDGATRQRSQSFFPKSDQLCAAGLLRLHNGTSETRGAFRCLWC